MTISQAILAHFYPQDTPLRRLLLHHSEQVRDKAFALLDNPALPPALAALDRDFIADGAMLHDIGIQRCHAPGILCEGTEPYIAHGIIGAQMLRQYGTAHGIDLEPYARICERHTGAGLSTAEIAAQHLPIPCRDYLPETPAEQLICLADKFYSKSGDMHEKPLPRVRASLAKFGPATLARFDALCRKFAIA